MQLICIGKMLLSTLSLYQILCFSNKEIFPGSREKCIKVQIISKVRWSLWTSYGERNFFIIYIEKFINLKKDRVNFMKNNSSSSVQLLSQSGVHYFSTFARLSSNKGVSLSGGPFLLHLYT